MRRKDREMPAEFAYEVSDVCEWATLAMVDEEQKPYCVPLSIVRKDNAIYFHCAKSGKKTDALKANDEVCISCVGYTHRMENEFTTEFESAIVQGKAAEVNDEAEKVEALRLLCQRHTPAHMAAFDSELAQSLSRTAVWKVEISSITGKRKKYGRHGKELKFGEVE